MQPLVRFRQQLDALPHFVVLAAPKPPQEDKLKAMVRNILESPPDMIYRDGIESVESVETDEDGNLTGVFTDRIGVNSVKRFRYLISEENIEYELENPDEAALMSIYQRDILALFAPMFGAGSKAKKKNCVKGISCGNGCVARSKKCQKGGANLSDETKTKIRKAKVAAEGGAIATVPKKPEEEKTGSDTFGVDPIDSKYASDNPSDADIENWFKDKIAEKPTAAQAEEDVVNEVKKSLWGGSDKKSAKLRDRVVDANSYAKAKYAAEQAEVKRRIKFNLRQNDDESLWFDSLTDFDDIPGKKKKLGKGKTEKLNAKYQKEYDDAVHWREVEAPRRAKEYAAKHKAIKEQSRAERIATLEAEFNVLKDTKMKQAEDLHERVMAGDKKAISQKREQVARRIPSEYRYSPIDYRAQNVKNAQNETAKEYLKAVSGNTLIPEFNLPKKFSRAEVKKAYRTLSTKYHPDRGGSAQAFNKLTIVYESLLEKASS